MKKIIITWYNNHYIVIFIVGSILAAIASLIAYITNKDLIYICSGLTFSIPIVTSISTLSRKIWERKREKEIKEEAYDKAKEKYEKLKNAAANEKAEAEELQKKAIAIIEPNKAQKEADKYLKEKYNTDSVDALKKAKNDLELLEIFKTEYRKNNSSEEVKKFIEVCFEKKCIDFYNPYNPEERIALNNYVELEDIKLTIHWIKEGRLDHAKGILRRAIDEGIIKMQKELKKATGGKPHITDDSTISGRDDRTHLQKINKDNGEIIK